MWLELGAGPGAKQEGRRSLGQAGPRQLSVVSKMSFPSNGRHWNHSRAAASSSTARQDHSRRLQEGTAPCAAQGQDLVWMKLPRWFSCVAWGENHRPGPVPLLFRWAWGID